MDYTTGAIICVAIMLVLLIAGVPIAYAMLFSSALIGIIVYGSSSLEKIGWTTFYLLYNLVWSPLPLFTLMACIIAETDIGSDLFLAARNWTSRIPGALIVASIIGEAGMAAALGASSATILAVGKVAVPEFERYKYNKAFGLGALLSGGVLGPLIPPSATMIMYSVLTDVPLGRLFIAGIIPGIVLAFMLSAMAIVLCIRRPELGGTAGVATWKERFSSLTKIWPVALTMFCILGSIYFGVATPTEAGGFGAFVVLIAAVAVFHFRWKNLYRAMLETAVLNAMLFFIFIAAVFFTYVVGSSSLAPVLAAYVKSLTVSPIVVIIAIQIILIILGCFIDGITIMLLTIPLFAPIVQALDLSLLWFGVLYVVNMEIALITPPMGINLFFVRNVFNVTTNEILRGALPFVIVLFIFLALMLAFPQLSIWLPETMRG